MSLLPSNSVKSDPYYLTAGAMSWISYKSTEAKNLGKTTLYGAGNKEVAKVQINIKILYDTGWRKTVKCDKCVLSTHCLNINTPDEVYDILYYVCLCIITINMGNAVHLEMPHVLPCDDVKWIIHLKYKFKLLKDLKHQYVSIILMCNVC